MPRCLVGVTTLERRLSAWCPTCALPSAVIGSMALEVYGRPAGVFQIAVCLDCGDTWEPT
jgi:hypothetical protein